MKVRKSDVGPGLGAFHTVKLMRNLGKIKPTKIRRKNAINKNTLQKSYE